jgi:NAD(P)-dependent dehydrogenase (short-subunit alcohol dehydrogenase family)
MRFVGLQLTVATAIVSLICPTVQSFATLPNVGSTIKNNHGELPMSSSDSAEDSSTTRRGFFKQALGGVAVTGLIANGVAVQGPEPYIPPPGSLTGKTIVITGGNTGLGLESAKRLAMGGATIILTSRSATKGARAVQSVKDYVKENNASGSGNVYSLPLDLCNLQSVKDFPDQLKTISDVKNIDVLLNNAGVMAVPDLQTTIDGYEKQFQTNHLGHFALTAVLEPLLNPNGSRVVSVSSAAHMIASKGLDMSNLNAEKDYAPWEAYGRSKLENILFTKELQKRADAAGKKITAVSLHPGAVRTDLQRYIVGEENFVSMQDAQPSTLDYLKVAPLLYFTKAVERGANSQVWLSSFQGENVGGKYFQNMKEVKTASAAEDMDKAKELWKVSEELSGIQFNL